MPALRLIFLLTLSLGLGACSMLPKEKDETKGWTAERFYQEGKRELDLGNYEEATRLFEKLEARYPFGRHAQQAQLEMAYAYYKSDEPESATATLNRFIKTYPRHPHLDYAYYLKGLVNFTRDEGIVERILPGDPSQRDVARAKQSFQDFALLLRRFPDSRYAEDAEKRLRYLRDLMASYELHVARFYLARGAYVAAVNRAKTIIERFQGTGSSLGALEVMAQGYDRLGLVDLAADARRVLELNSVKTDRKGG